MLNPEHVAILKQGVEEWNKWREENPEILPQLHNVNLSSRDLSGYHLSNGDLSRSILHKCNLTGAKLNGLDLRNSDITLATLNGANLEAANLNNAKLGWSKLNGALLNKARLAEADLTSVELIGAKLQESELFETKLNRAILVRADLSGARIRGVDFSRADLSKANLSKASLKRTLFQGTDLTEANLHETWISGSYFYSSILTGVDFAGARLSHATFGDIDFRSVNGIDKIRHIGPSTIGIDTLVASAGLIPELFLKGAGVPDAFIKYSQSLVVKAIEHYSAFISYSSKDDNFARRLHADLQDNGVRCWFAPKDMKTGDKTRPTIDEAIRIRDKLLIILSEHSIVSDWVEKEVETAFEEERIRGETKLFPIRLDDAVMETDEAWAADIRRTRHIGDFRGWKNHDQYQKAFDKVLRDLRTTEE